MKTPMVLSTPLLANCLFAVLNFCSLPLCAQRETLQAGTQLELELAKPISSEDATPGAVVDFFVRTNVVSAKGYALIQERVYGQGRIVKVVRARESRTGEGILEIEANSVRAVDGTRVLVISSRLIARGNCRVSRNCEAQLNSGMSLSATVQEDYIIITAPKS